MDEQKIILKPGREKSLLRRHPWIFSGAIQKAPLTGFIPGSTVAVYSQSGQIIGRGAYNPNSQIAVRMWSFNPEEDVDRDFFHKRIAAAIRLRRQLPGCNEKSGVRLLHAENDGLPGIIAEQFGGLVVMQLSTAGAYFWQKVLADELTLQTGCECLYEKSDADVNRLEGLADIQTGRFGNLSSGPVYLEEHKLKYRLGIADGQKTGFYLDQRNNRLSIRQFAEGKRVLDCFSFSGGFTLNALAAGASHVSVVESSSEAIKLIEDNILINGFDREKVNLINGNAFEILRKMRDSGERFDLVVLDPPKLAPTAAQVEKAARAYKDINLLAFKLLNPGGILFTFSCSGGVPLALFQKIVADAALDAGKNTRIIRYLHQSEDHPVNSAFPEGEYLKGMVMVVE